jgi:hypothetical protein
VVKRAGLARSGDEGGSGCAMVGVMETSVCIGEGAGEPSVGDEVVVVVIGSSGPQESVLAIEALEASDGGRQDGSSGHQSGRRGRGLLTAREQRKILWSCSPGKACGGRLAAGDGRRRGEDGACAGALSAQALELLEDKQQCGRFVWPAACPVGREQLLHARWRTRWAKGGSGGEGRGWSEVLGRVAASDAASEGLVARGGFEYWPPQRSMQRRIRLQQGKQGQCRGRDCGSECISPVHSQRYVWCV